MPPTREHHQRLAFGGKQTQIKVFDFSAVINSDIFQDVNKITINESIHSLICYLYK